MVRNHVSQRAQQRRRHMGYCCLDTILTNRVIDHIESPQIFLISCCIADVHMPCTTRTIAWYHRARVFHIDPANDRYRTARCSFSMRPSIIAPILPLQGCDERQPIY